MGAITITHTRPEGLLLFHRSAWSTAVKWAHLYARMNRRRVRVTRCHHCKAMGYRGGYIIQPL